VLVLGCGALGAAVAELLCRAGVGRLRLVDRDFVDWTNLQRQGLYAEEDARQALPKAVAAAQRLRAIDAALDAEAVVADVGARDLPGLVAGCDLAIDGTDNFRTRHLLNEACVRAGLPWIYGACVGAYGCSATILPREGPCLRCLQDQMPAAGDSPTCDTVGIIGPAVQLVAAWQVAEALKLLVGDRAALRGELWSSDLWAGTFQRMKLAPWRDPACTVCGDEPTYPLLSQSDAPAVMLCGRDAVQIRRAVPDLAALARQLGERVEATNEYLLRWRDGEKLGTCFRDGRVIVQGVADAAAASAFCDRWLG
jgi:molybdopterin/thiamine biosynthesis adenylyltransferase